MSIRGKITLITCILILLALSSPLNASFSSITITNVKPTELHPGDTKEVIVTVKNNGGMDARDIRLAFQNN